MNIVSRVRLLFTLSTRAELTPIPDPRPALVDACAQQRALLHPLRSGLVEVAVARQELRHQMKTLCARLPDLEDEAQRALAAGRDDLAHLALLRKQICLAGLNRLESQLAEVAEDEQRLTLAEQHWALRLDRLQSCCDALTACYISSEPAGPEALRGIAPECADWSHVLEQAEVKIERIRSRAAMLDALLKSGELAKSGRDPAKPGLRGAAQRQADNGLPISQEALGWLEGVFG